MRRAGKLPEAEGLYREALGILDVPGKPPNNTTAAAQVHTFLWPWRIHSHVMQLSTDLPGPVARHARGVPAPELIVVLHPALTDGPGLCAQTPEQAG